MISFEEGLTFANETVFQKVNRHLSPVEIAMIEGAWHEKTYDDIADATNYSPLKTFLHH